MPWIRCLVLNMTPVHADSGPVSAVESGRVYCVLTGGLDSEDSVRPSRSGARRSGRPQYQVQAIAEQMQAETDAGNPTRNIAYSSESRSEHSEKASVLAQSRDEGALQYRHRLRDSIEHQCPHLTNLLYNGDLNPYIMPNGTISNKVQN